MAYNPVTSPKPPITWPKETTFVGKKDQILLNAPKMVAGKWDYASDIVLPEMLYARILGSPYGHAKITSIDTSKAEALPGVKAIATYKDNPIFFPQEVKWWGCPVAAVAATDIHIAEEAFDLIDVKYEVLPFTLDPLEARDVKVETGIAPKNLVGPEERVKRGDWTKGFAEADVIFEDEVGEYKHFFPHVEAEPRACVAKWDGDYLTIWAASAAPFGARDGVATALNWPRNKVRVISHGSGGSFGDKLSCPDSNVIAATLAKKAGLPVKLVYDAYERAVMSGQCPSFHAKLKIGAKKDGTFTAFEETLYSQLNAFLTSGGAAAVPSLGGTSIITCHAMTYKIPNAHMTAVSYCTNRCFSTAMRSGGNEQHGSFILSTFIDEFAEKLGIDPVELILKNAMYGKPGEVKDQDSGLAYSSLAFDECITKAADAIGWKTKWHKPGTKTLPDGRLHGIGIDVVVSTHGGLSTGSGSIILMTPDGKAQLQVGLSSVTGGSNTSAAIIAAEALGLASMDDITIPNPGDTACTQDCGSEGGSTRTATVGAGAYMAALDAKNQLITIGATLLGVKPEEVEAKGGKVYVKADPTKARTYSEIMTNARTSGVIGTNIIGRGYQWFITPYSAHRGPCVEIAEVAVDPETGAVEVLSMVCADDLGRAVHWKSAENQCEGGMLWMINEAIMDSDRILDKATGAALNANLLDLRLQTSLDVPDDLKVILVEPIDVAGPYGAKGLGEPPAATGIGAVTNAIYNATGKRIKRQPATEIDVLKALGKA